MISPHFKTIQFAKMTCWGRNEAIIPSLIRLLLRKLYFPAFMGLIVAWTYAEKKQKQIQSVCILR